MLRLLAAAGAWRSSGATAAAAAGLIQQGAPGRGSPNRSLHLAPPFLVEEYTPVSVTTHRLGGMKGKVAAAMKELEDCRACPRCGGLKRGILLVMLEEGCSACCCAQGCFVLYH